MLQADQTPNIHQADTNERAGGTTPPALGIRSSALGSIVIRPGERIVANAIAAGMGGEDETDRRGRRLRLGPLARARAHLFRQRSGCDAV